MTDWSLKNFLLILRRNLSQCNLYLLPLFHVAPREGRASILFVATLQLLRWDSPWALSSQGRRPKSHRADSAALWSSPLHLVQSVCIFPELRRQNWTQYCGWGSADKHKVEWDNHISISLAMSLWIQSRILFASIAAVGHCWIILSLLSTRTLPARLLLPSCRFQPVLGSWVI